MKFITTKIITWCLIFSAIIPYSAEASYCIDASNDTTDIELDINSTTCEPPNLRKSNIQFDIPEDMEINLTGLADLNISGSGQFSKQGIKTIKNYIGGNYDLYDIDLRQEPHGFINEDPVSWSKIEFPKDYSLEEVIDVENSKLLSVPINSKFTYANVGCREIIAKSIEAEQKFVEDNLFTYIRFPVPDGEIPNEEIVSDFIKFAKNRPMNSWLHFHCKEGIGRTTTFMIMYDIIRNKNAVSLEDIISRQILLCEMKTDERNGFLTNERLEFFENFYNMV